MAPHITKNATEEVIDPNEDKSIEFGKILANPPPGEEVVISGKEFNSLVYIVSVSGFCFN